MTANLLDTIRAACGDMKFQVGRDPLGAARISVVAEEALALLQRLQEAPETSMRRLIDITGIDRGTGVGRFEIVYWLHSPALNERLRIHVVADRDREPDGERPMVDSVCVIWPSANWLEREVFDLFGIEFRGHPDLRRILLEPGFEGAPLRKDYPRQPHLALPKEAQE